jgi:prepilin-type N-terminal cleavage/methylation domain-containing protein
MSTFKKTAFTLIELLVVIAIIGILSGLIVVTMGGMSDKATTAKSQVFSNSLKNSIMMDLISEWRLEGDAGDTWGINEGTIVGATTLTSGCARDNCLSFDGVDDYLNMGSDNSLNFTGDYTIEMFVYNEAGTASYPVLFNRAAQTSANGFFWTYTVGTNQQDIRYQYCNGTTSASTSFYNVLPKDKWTHLVFTFTDSDKSLKLYTNGSYVITRTLTTALPVDDGELYFGTYRASGSGYAFKGRMDEIRWYDVAMPAYIIKEHYFSALNNLLASGQVTKDEYMNFISQTNNTYGKY